MHVVNTKKIKARIKEIGSNQTLIATAMGIAQSTLNQKINNIRPMDLTEAEALQRELNIPDSEFHSYFFRGE